MGKKHYAVPYRPGLYLVYFVVAGVAFVLNSVVSINLYFFSYLFKAVIFALFIGSFFVIQRYDKDKIDKPE
jgi:positive regulator of sigma E activity